MVAYDRAGSGLASQLVLSAPGRAVTARITEIGTTGSAGTPQVVQIQAGHSMVAQLGKGGGAIHKSAFSVIVTPPAPGRSMPGGWSPAAAPGARCSPSSPSSAA